MRARRLTIVVLVTAAALAVSLARASAQPLGSTAASSCRLLTAPSSLGKTLLGLHRAYERRQPHVHNPTITGPVGRVKLGICGSERYASAIFDAKYNGIYFGPEDQPERFTQKPGQGWRDLGNTGGDPCGSDPTALLKEWKAVTSCPG